MPQDRFDPRRPYRNPGESEAEEENRRNKNIPPDYSGPGMPREPGLIGNDALDTQSRDARWYHYMKMKKKKAS